VDQLSKDLIAVIARDTVMREDVKLCHKSSFLFYRRSNKVGTITGSKTPAIFAIVISKYNSNCHYRSLL